jgi:hypothetical protein
MAQKIYLTPETEALAKQLKEQDTQDRINALTKAKEDKENRFAQNAIDRIPERLHERVLKLLSLKFATKSVAAEVK